MFVRNMLHLSWGLKWTGYSSHLVYKQVARKVANQIEGWENRQAFDTENSDGIFHWSRTAQCHSTRPQSEFVQQENLNRTMLVKWFKPYTLPVSCYNQPQCNTWSIQKVMKLLLYTKVIAKIFKFQCNPLQNQHTAGSLLLWGLAVLSGCCWLSQNDILKPFKDFSIEDLVNSLALTQKILVQHSSMITK